jgi:DNA helicase-2/ATP-dependent DNA helicase PcrA
VEDLEKNLTADQFSAVRSDAQRLRILAGAGTGKTRVLTRRIAYQAKALRIDAQHSLCLTFSKRAALELQTRLNELGLGNLVTVGTFHSIAYAQLQARWSDLHITVEPKLLPNREKFFFSLLPNSFTAIERSFILNEINWCTAQRIAPTDYLATAEKTNRRDTVQHSIVSEYYRKFVNAKRQKNCIDFDDILELAIQFLSEDTKYAAARHWKFQDLFVDEFQDVNPLQFALLRSWLGTKSSLTVVGDPNQAIYSWNGADSSYLNDFGVYFPGSETIHLSQNFRSTPEILSTASLLLPSQVPLIANKPSGPLPTVRSESDEFTEAKSIAGKVMDIESGSGEWKNQAVLVRTHGQITSIVNAFTEKGIPFRVHTDSQTTSTDENENAVRILTFHAAKGLEWRVVHVSGIEEGLTPIAHAINEAQQDEERRLMYVALTRAERQLHLSWARKRRFGIQRERKPSIFLKEISSVVTAPPPISRMRAKKDLAKKIREFRSKWREETIPNSVEPPLTNKLEALTKLRASIAKVNDISPNSVFSDEVLERLAIEMPDSRKQLKSISGLSPLITDRFGDQILALISEE